MSDKSRKSVVYLLDDTQMEIAIAPALLTQELLDMAASHFQLKEKEYFGLTVDSPHDAVEYVNWLQNDKPVLDQDIPPVGVLKFHFTVKHFVERVDFLRDPITVELFYLHAKQSIVKGSLPCESDVVFLLAAHSLQVYAQDFTSEESAREDLKRINWLPARTLRELVSIPLCENKVLGYYKKMVGKSRGAAIVGYLNVAMSLPSYGVHYFQVKDKKDVVIWLGFGSKGIGLYDPEDKIRPKEFHTWKHLDNIHYRDKRFTIEIYDSRSGGSNEASRRGPSSCTTKAWYCSSTRMAQALFSMAIQQHQFWRDKKSLKKSSSHPATRSTDLARLLSRTCISLSSAGSMAGSQVSLPTASNKAAPGGADEMSAAAKRANTEMFLQLKARRSRLQEDLTRREQELRNLCIRESEICGHLSLDLHASPDHPDISIKRRIGTSYKFPDHVFKSPEAEANEEISKLEKEIEIQLAITNAAEKIAKEPTKSQKVRKERYTTVKRSRAKLEVMQQKLNALHESFLHQVPPQFLPRFVPTGAPISQATTPNGAYASREFAPDTPGTLSKTSSYSSLVSTQSKSAATSSSRDALLDSVTEDIVANLIAGNRTVSTSNEPLGNGISGSAGGASGKRHNSLSRLALGSTSPTKTRHTSGAGSPASTARLMKQRGGNNGPKLASSLDELSREAESSPRNTDEWYEQSRTSPRSLTFSDTEVEWMTHEFGEGTLV